jgi:hypothetical protein
MARGFPSLAVPSLVASHEMRRSADGLHPGEETKNNASTDAFKHLLFGYLPGFIRGTDSYRSLLLDLNTECWSFIMVGRRFSVHRRSESRPQCS